jgi:hypothetical protein
MQSGRRGPCNAVTASRVALCKWAVRRNWSVGLDLFSKFSDLIQIIVNFRNLHIIHLNSENYETNFVG